MEILVRANADVLVEGKVWLLKGAEALTPQLAPALMGQAYQTVISTKSAPIQLGGGKLEICASDLSLWSEGDDSDALLIFQKTKDTIEKTSGIVDEPREFPAALPHKSGSVQFLRECGALGLPATVIQLAEALLADVAEYSGATLVEGQSRKWVMKPDNFLALTIQNRNQQFCVQVRSTPALRDMRTLDVRDDRPSYSRFWLQRADQLAEALAAVRASWSAAQ